MSVTSTRVLVSPEKMVFTSLNQSKSTIIMKKKSISPTLWVSNTDVTKAIQIGSGINPKWPLDDKRILFHSKTGDNSDVWMIDADGTNLTQITTDSADDVDPSWSPNGNKVAFSSKRSANFDIWMLDLEKNQLVQLTNSPATDGHPVWSSDERLIFFHSHRLGNFDIWRLTPVK